MNSYYQPTTRATHYEYNETYCVCDVGVTWKN